MDPAASLPHQTTTTTSQLQYPESTNSSPRSRQAETWDEPLPPVPGAKLRLMCSYGGHIIPRPHDKSLCYVGGDTRIVVVDRSSSLAELHSRLSHTLLNGRHFTLKYQLPTEELDSLISVTTEEDLENMVEEYDRTVSASPLRPSRLRLFLFLSKPETAASMGCLLADAKSETWFVDALNNAGLLSRGLSDSATENNNIVDLDGMIQSGSVTDLQKNHHQNEALISSSDNNKQYTVPDSQVVIETTTTSSFDSSSVSSPSMANLPPIKVRVEGGGLRVNDKMFGLEEQLSQINVGTQTTQKQEDGLDTAAVPPTIFAINSAVISDYEKLDDGAPPGIRKPPLPLQLVPRKTGDGYGLSSPDSRHAPGGFNLASPDSVARYVIYLAFA
nr:Histidine--tRNA ligase [Ipomoea batatas]